MFYSKVYYMIEMYPFHDPANNAYNVLDNYKDMRTDEVRAVRDESSTGLVNVAMNLTNDFNKASVVRAHCAFGGSEMYFVGKRRYDRRGTVGTHHYVNVFHADTPAEVIESLRSRGYTIFAVDNTPEFNPVSVYDAEIPYLSAFIYGEENAGLSSEIVALCDAVTYIPQPSPVPRSVNVAQAAAIMMSEYSRRHSR